MDDIETLKFIDDNKLIAVIRASELEDANAIAKAVIAGGFKILEISMNMPHATKLIESLSKKENLLVGAGSVPDAEAAQRAISAGAKYISSRFTDKAIITVSKNAGVFVIQGAATPTEIIEAQSMHVDLISLYPVDLLGGSKFLKRVRKLGQTSKLMVAGGIDCENFLDYIRDGAVAVSIGGAICDKALIRAHSWQEITERAKKVQQKLESLKVAK